jgi:hypothetical protein
MSKVRIPNRGLAYCCRYIYKESLAQARDSGLLLMKVCLFCPRAQPRTVGIVEGRQAVLITR